MSWPFRLKHPPNPTLGGVDGVCKRHNNTNDTKTWMCQVFEGQLKKEK